MIKLKNYNIIFQVSIFIILIFSADGYAKGIAGDDSEWFYPAWAAAARYNAPIKVLDTDSALGRYSLKTKTIGLNDIVKFHGHFCDGMVIAWVEINAALKKLFPDGVIDRTDIRCVSKNGPCWADTAAYMTGARINYKTMRIDNSIGDGFIVQKISTGEAYEVRLKKGVFPDAQAELENAVCRLRAENLEVSKQDTEKLEKMADALSFKLLNTAPEKILEMKELKNYNFNFCDIFGNRRDIINKNGPR